MGKQSHLTKEQIDSALEACIDNLKNHYLKHRKNKNGKNKSD